MKQYATTILYKETVNGETTAETEYNILQGFGAYPAITVDQLQRHTEADALKRLNAFKAYLDASIGFCTDITELDFPVKDKIQPPDVFVFEAQPLELTFENTAAKKTFAVTSTKNGAPQNWETDPLFTAPSWAAVTKKSNAEIEVEEKQSNTGAERSFQFRIIQDENETADKTLKVKQSEVIVLPPETKTLHLALHTLELYDPATVNVEIYENNDRIYFRQFYFSTPSDSRSEYIDFSFTSYFDVMIKLRIEGGGAVFTEFVTDNLTRIAESGGSERFIMDGNDDCSLAATIVDSSPN